MSEIVKVIDGEVCLAQSVLNEYSMLMEFKQRAEELEKEIRSALLTAMEDNGIKKFENDIISCTYIAPTTRRSVDTSLLKSDGLYEKYSSETETGASVRVKLKNEK